MYNTSSDKVEEVQLEFFAPMYENEFFAHGISLVRHGNAIQLYSVNHGPGGDSVFVFEWIAAKRVLMQKAKFRSELMMSMNDVVAVGGGIFYATNDIRQPHGSPLGLAEGFLRLPSTYAIGCDLYAQKCFKAADGIRSGNGITHYKPTNQILIAGATDQAVHVYNRQQDNSLVFDYSIFIDTAPDNLVVDANEVVWIAAHPKSSRTTIYFSFRFPNADRLLSCS